MLILLLFFSSMSTGIGVHLWGDFFTKLSVFGIYHGFSKDNIHKFNYGVHPHINYVLDTENKKIILNVGDFIFF